MGYDDGFYYGKGKIICLATKSEDNDKIVTVSGGGNTYEAVMAGGKAEFSVPGRNRYSINMAGEFSKTIDVSYGQCVGVYMADGYDLVTQEELSTALKDLEDSLKENFQGGVDSIYNAIKSKGTTPASKSLSDVVAGIGKLKNVYTVKSGLKLSGSSVVVDCAAVPNAASKTATDFLVVVTNIDVNFIDVDNSYSINPKENITTTYDASKKQLTIKFKTTMVSNENFTITCKPTVTVYAI